MFVELKNILVFGGIFTNQNPSFVSAVIRKSLIIGFTIVSMVSCYISTLMYSITYKDLVTAVKSAGYSYNNIGTVLMCYVFLIWSRKELQQIIDGWDSIISDSLFEIFINFVCVTLFVDSLK